jgi:hypothetical protein
MRYALAAIFFLIILAAFAFFNLIMQQDSQGPISSVAAPPTLAYVESGNIFSAFFKEPFERVVLLARDGTFYAFTTQDENAIAVYPEQIYKHLLKQGTEAKDLVIIIHNHWYPDKFSPGDLCFYRYFVKRGFQGSFCIFYSYSRHVLVKED